MQHNMLLLCCLLPCHQVCNKTLDKSKPMKWLALHCGVA
jgi:hypothetical protein